MKILNLTPIFFGVVTLLIVQPCNGQAVLDFPLVNSLSTSRASVTSKPFRICNADDKLSKLYCTCSEQVVSCDFSKFTVNNTKNGSQTVGNMSGADSANNGSIEVQSPAEHEELILYGFRFPPTASRFCICNTPPNVHLTFSENYFLPPQVKNNFQRFDLFNLSGITQFKGDFSLNFHGDLYISNVRRIPELAQNEFGRGKDEPTLDVQDKECCSPIKVNQNYDKPVMFIENSTIDRVRSRGLDDEHLWRTVILKSSKFNAVDEYGINFNSFNKGCNIAILRVTFKNVSVQGLLYQDTANLLIARNEFRHSNRVPAYFFKSAYQLTNSNVILMDNWFTNTVVLDVDANHVVSWYNFFDLWDNETFAPMKHTAFQKDSDTGNSGRTVSLRYNVIAWSKLHENSLDFGHDSTVSLSDNVLGTCSCPTDKNMDKFAKPEHNWCYSGDVVKRNGNCSIKLDAALNQCKKSQSVNFQHLCNDKQISVPVFPGIGANLTEEVGKMQINSIFIARIVKEFRSMFGVNSITTLNKIWTPVKKETPHAGSSSGTSHDNDQQDENPGINANPVNKEPATAKESSKKNSFVVPIIITLIVAIFIGIVGFFVYKNKHRFFRRFGHHELPDESYSQMS